MTSKRQPLDLDFSPATPPANKAEEVKAGLISFLREEVMPGLDEVSQLWDSASSGSPLDAFNLGRKALQLVQRIDTELPKAEWLFDISYARSLTDAHHANQVAKRTHRAGSTVKIIDTEAKADIADVQQLVSMLRNYQKSLGRHASFSQTLLRVWADRESSSSLENT